ncbi:Uncharacterised protein r2_g3445 [Pycnogonum litorale]
MTTKCCKCVRGGTCVRCSCVRQGMLCTDCQSRSCRNRGLPLATQASDEPEIGANLLDPSPVSTATEFYDPPDTDPDMGKPSYKLPTFNPASESPYIMGELNKESLETQIEDAYKEIVKWQQNLFILPRGKCGSDFVKELTKILSSFAEGAAMEKISVKAALVMQALLLQKPHSKADLQSNKQCLIRRLNQWSKGEIKEIVKEGKIIQNHLPSRKHGGNKCNDTARTFAHLIGNGKVRQALGMTKPQHKAGVLDVHEIIDGKSVLNILKEKHPEAMPASNVTLLSDVDSEDLSTVFHPVLFERLKGPVVRRVIANTRGSAGPSGVDASGWCRHCTMYGSASEELCNVIAACARRIATEYIDPECMQALTAGRLIPLDKNPGVRPIGVGETLRRIICKAILCVSRSDIQLSVGISQLCAGLESGCEAGVNAMRKVFENEQTEAMILVDATNAFNSLNRAAMLHNIQKLCPMLAPSVINIYRHDSSLYTSGETISSTEGTTQGDPLAMPVYAISTLPLINKIRSTDVRQIW